MRVDEDARRGMDPGERMFWDMFPDDVGDWRQWRWVALLALLAVTVLGESIVGLL